MMRLIIVMVLAALALASPASAESVSYSMDMSVQDPINETMPVGFVVIDATDGTEMTGISLSIDEPNSYFGWSFSNFSRTLVNGSINITINVTIPINFPEGEYAREVHVSYNASGEEVNSSYSFNLTVLKYSSFEVDAGNFTPTIDNGEAGVLGTLTFSNTGNSELTILSSMDGNCSGMLSTPKSFPLYRQMEEDIAVQYHVTRSQQQGNYSCSITYDAGGVNYTIDIGVSVVDRIPPDIRNISTPNIMATTTGILSLHATDNIGIHSSIVNVTRLYRYNETVHSGNETSTVERNDTVLVGSYTMLNVPDTDTWQVEFRNTSEIGTYYADIIVEDMNGNAVLNRTEFQVTLLDAVEYDHSVVQKRIKHGYKRFTNAFNLTEDTPITISIDDMNYAGNWSIFIKAPGGLEDYISSSNPGAKLAYDSAGGYDIGIYGDSIGTLHGRMCIGVIEQHVPVDCIVLEAEFTNYSIPTERRNDTFSWGWEYCEYEDKGDIELSNVQCTKFIDCGKGSCDIDERLVYMTPSEKQAMETACDAEKSVLEGRLNSQRILKIIFMLLTMVLSMKVIWDRYQKGSFNFVIGGRK